MGLSKDNLVISSFLGRVSFELSARLCLIFELSAILWFQSEILGQRSPTAGACAIA
ncbi:hypothetical protein [Anabaena sp. CCY 9910]|uniref:hypothetical protein n=1 Tax=Anabaena sp. CCY 9910 TaxID=3103870 RepID=UPI0039E02DE0